MTNEIFLRKNFWLFAILMCEMLPVHAVSFLRQRKKAIVEQPILHVAMQKEQTSTPLSRQEKDALRKEIFNITCRKSVKEHTCAELERIVACSKLLGWNEKALQYLKQLILQEKNSEKISRYKLEQADIHFDMGDLKKSAELYRAYSELYPGDKRIEYAQYKGILSSFYTTFLADQDQTPTHSTIKLADVFLNGKIIEPHYKKEVNEIRTRCYQLLCKHEQKVFEYYVKRKSFKAADSRIAYIKTDLASKIPFGEQTILTLEYKLAFAKGDTPQINDISQKLVQKFPQYVLANKELSGIVATQTFSSQNSDIDLAHKKYVEQF